jgi:hypothetical protein
LPTFRQFSGQALAHRPKFAIRRWKADAKFVPATFENGTLPITIDPEGLELIDEVSDSGRREIYRIMSNEILETARFLEVVFEGILQIISRSENRESATSPPKVAYSSTA